MPLAARVTDKHVCPKFEGPKPHVGGPILPPGCATVLIGDRPAARRDDKAVCVGPTDSVSAGSSTVLIGDKQAARLGDSCEHGGSIVEGCQTVDIGG